MYFKYILKEFNVIFFFNTIYKTTIKTKYCKKDLFVFLISYVSFSLENQL